MTSLGPGVAVRVSSTYQRVPFLDSHFAITTPRTPALQGDVWPASLTVARQLLITQNSCYYISIVIFLDK